MSYAHTEVAQIAAISSNRCIGKNNELPWHISQDLQHFKKMINVYINRYTILIMIVQIKTISMH